MLLVAAGLGLVGVGGLVLLDEVPPERWLGIAVWVGSAIVLHDGVVAPVAVAVGLGAARVRERIGRTGVAVAQAALLVGAVLTAIALPAIISQARGNANPTILLGSYGVSLAVAWAVLAAVAAVAVGWSAERERAARDHGEGTARTK
ncbi:hypothetical protein GCM10011372_24100 [Agromyces bauzanensis]|uniref:Uncharacterized protein n=1 Tax=Agromyces bauzanensis TaxID=1308924 RepID=A0A917UTM0_9MICO|nr:hypothetical protein GCM10011372_24100 [Agromyces bauzanensis]